MRYLLLILFFVPAIAQNTQPDPNELITVPRHILTKQQINQAEINAQISAAGKYAGLGKEIGFAVSESLSSVTNETAKFSETGIGKVTMGIVVWKILGKDIVGIIIGLPLIFFSLIIITISYFKNCRVRRILVSKTKDSAVYELINKPKDYQEIELYNWRGVLHLVTFIIACVIGGIFIF